jgi:hypothetical protein
MPTNIYLRALIVVAVTFLAVQATAWAINQLYQVINDLDYWAISMLGSPSKAAVIGIVAGLVYLVVSKSIKKQD